MIHDIEFGGKARAKPESDSEPAAAGAAASNSGSGAPAAAGAAATSSGSGAPPLPKKVGGRGRGRPLRRRDTEDSERSDSAVEYRKSVEEAIDEVMNTKSR